MRPRPDWWKTHFDARYLREFAPLFAEERSRREVARLVELLGLPAQARVLDCPCGQGRHSHALAEAGFAVTGLDYSRTLLAVARRRRARRGVRFVHGDMRRLPARWTRRFDAVVNLGTSFGFFLDPADDARTIAGFARVLRPGGVFIWQGGNRDGVMARFLGRDWWSLADGTLVGQERRFDPLAGVLSVRSAWHGPRDRGEREHRIRLYTPTRLAELCAAAGLVVEGAYDGWTSRPVGRRSSEMLLVARRATA